MPETLSPLLSTRDVARAITDSPFVIGSVRDHHIKRLYQCGHLSEPPRAGGRRVIYRDDLPEIVAKLQELGWLPSVELEATA
jgi:hypothetical protein